MLLTWCLKEFGQRATLESCNYTAFGAQIMTGVQQDQVMRELAKQLNCHIIRWSKDNH